MKNAIITFLLFLCATMIFVQSESAKPTFGIELDKEVALSETYKDIAIESKSTDLGDLYVNGVNYLYAFPDNAIQVGKEMH